MGWTEHEIDGYHVRWDLDEADLELHMEKESAGQWIVTLFKQGDVEIQEEFGGVMKASQRAREIREEHPSYKDCQHHLEWVDAETYEREHVIYYHCDKCGAEICDVYVLHEREVRAELGGEVVETERM